MKIKTLSYLFLLLSFISPQPYAAQLSATATAENELDARAEALRRLAESIQVNVKGETLVTSQFKNNEATQELVDRVKTSTELTLLGAEVFVIRTKQGYRAEAQLDTEQSFNLYLTKIKADKQLLDNQLTLYQQQHTDLAKLTLANQLIPLLSLHIKDYLVATMLAVKPNKKQQDKIPLWMADLSSKGHWLTTLKDYHSQLSSSSITEPKLAAYMLVSNIKQQHVYTCPIFRENGSWLNEKNNLNYEIRKALPLSSQSKDNAQYFLIGHAEKNGENITSIAYQLVDVNGHLIQKNQVNYVFSSASWQIKSKIDDAVLTSMTYELKDKAGKLIPKNITTSKQLYTLIENKLLAKQSLVVEDPCRPITLLSHSALTNAYGVNTLVVITISGSLSTFVLRPDLKEHEFALAKVTYQQVDLINPENVTNKVAAGKKFPVLDPLEAIVSAVETAFDKLN